MPLRKGAKTVLDVSKEVGQKVNVDKIKFTFMSSRQNAGWYPNMKTANKVFKKYIEVEIFESYRRKSELLSPRNKW
jgi:hypothetical protein